MRRGSGTARGGCGFTWFKAGCLVAFLLGAASLHTPYPLQLLRMVHGWCEEQDDASPSRSKGQKPRKKTRAQKPHSGSSSQAETSPAPDAVTPAAEPAPVIGPVPLEPWKLGESMTMPDITLPPFPPSFPTRVDPGKFVNIARMAPGLTLEGKVNFEPGSTAAQDRVKPEAYRVCVSLDLLLPRAASGAELKESNPCLPRVLAAYDELMATAQVSPWYHALYLHKQNRLRSGALSLDRLLDRHNFFDTDTILELQAPGSGRKVLWMQADMDVVSDGSDGDRLVTMPEEIRKSEHYQPSTSYFWRKRTAKPNPLLPTWEAKLRRLEKQKASADEIEATKRVISDLKNFSYLLAEYDPFIVIPLTFREGGESPYRPAPGDYAVVVVDNRLFPAIVGDYGPKFKTGEASVRLAREVNPQSSTVSRAVSDLGVSYIIFPGSREPEKGPIDYDRLSTRCRELLEEMGGLGPEACFIPLQDKLGKSSSSSD